MSAPVKFLIVDDNFEFAKQIVGILNDRGFDARAVATALAAVTAVQQGFYPNKILMDVNLPDVNGGILFKAFRDAGLPMPPVVAITGDPLDAHSMPPGVPLLKKPAEIEDIVRTLEQPVPEAVP